MSCSGDLIISDEEIETYKSRMDAIGAQVESEFAEFVAQLQRVCDYAITVGNVHDNLQAFVNSLEKMKGQLVLFTGTVSQCSSEFLSTIDELDANLY